MSFPLAALVRVGPRISVTVEIASLIVLWQALE
jgi:hypothetical protein